MDSTNNLNQQTNPIPEDIPLPPKSLNGRIMSDTTPYKDEIHNTIFKMGYKTERIMNLLRNILLVLALVFFVAMVGNNGFGATLLVTVVIFGGLHWGFGYIGKKSRVMIFPYAKEAIETVHSIVYNLPYNITVTMLFEILRGSMIKSQYTVEEDAVNNIITIKSGEMMYSISSNDFQGTFTVKCNTTTPLSEKQVIAWENAYNSMIVDIPQIAFMIQKSVSDFYALLGGTAQ